MVARNTGEPCKKIVDAGAVFQVGEERLDGNTRPAEDPGTTDLVRSSLDCGALIPIKHEERLRDLSSAGKLVTRSAEQQRQSALINATRLKSQLRQAIERPPHLRR
jgi:hypothetical protein